MPEKCLSKTDKPNLLGFLVSDLIIICSFVLSQPVYFLYIAFFSPYLLRIFSFLSPLFITTSLLIITLLTISPGLIDDNFSATLSFLQTAYHALLLKLQPGLKINIKEHGEEEEEEEESHSLEALQVYNFVFDTSMIDSGGYQVDDSGENPEERILQTVESSVLKIPQQDRVLTVVSGGDSENCVKCDKIQPLKQEKSNGEFLRLLDYFEKMKPSNAEEIKKFEPPQSRKLNKAVEKQKQEPFVMNGYEARCDNKIGNGIDNAPRQSAKADEKDNGRDYSSKSDNSTKLESANTNEKDKSRDYFSKSADAGEKDSRRDNFSRSDTSIKYESTNVGEKDNGRDYYSRTDSSTEYDNANADEKDNGRDYSSGGDASTKYDLGRSGSARKEKLWNRTLACKLFEERHKVDSVEDMDSLWEAYEVNSMKEDCKSDHHTKRRDHKYRGKASYYEEEDDNNEDDDEDSEIVAQLCCLQAFKFSAGKMHFGVGKRNLARISKAVKGIGWLHKVSRHGKKVHNGDSFRFA